MKYPSFKDSWTYYYHDLDNKKWDITSYHIIIKNITDPEQLVAINETIPETIVKNAMLFMMRNHIQPMWEDPYNCKGGYLSFKIVNKSVPYIWKSLIYALCGETLFVDKTINDFVNGISVSPKKSFCIIKIWLSDCQYKDVVLNPIPQLNSEDVKFTPFAETDMNLKAGS